jgi:hypothetical protein
VLDASQTTATFGLRHTDLDEALRATFAHRPNVTV